MMAFQIPFLGDEDDRSEIRYGMVFDDDVETPTLLCTRYM